MSGKRFIDSVSVKAPCGELWDEMKGNSQVRFCSHCAKNVTNISEMSAAVARRFVLDSNGNICVRIIRDPKTGRTRSADRPMYQISRAPILATGLLVASLAAPSGVLGQAPIPTNSDPVIELPVPDKEPLPAEKSLVNLKGKVTAAKEDKEDDELWLGYPSVRVVGGGDTVVEATSEVDDEGNYQFSDLPPGLYELRIVPGAGFQKKVILNVQVLPGHVTEQNVDIKRSGAPLQVGYGFGGAMAIPQFTNEVVEAANNGDEKALRRLLKSGADPNGVDPNYDGITALFLAVENNDLAIAKLLIRFGAKVDRSDDSGNTPFARIEKETSVELATFLIRNGADVNRRDSEGMTPLMNAVNVGNNPLVRVLVESGSIVSETDDEGNTALIMAAAGNDIEIVETLLELGSDVGAENKHGENAYDSTGNKEIERLLELRGSRTTQSEFSTAIPRLPTEAEGVVVVESQNEDLESETESPTDVEQPNN